MYRKKVYNNLNKILVGDFEKFVFCYEEIIPNPIIARRAFVWDPFKFRCPSGVRPASVRVRPDFWEFYAS